MNNRKLTNKIIHWIKNHKFWTSVIIFSVILALLYAFHPFNPFGLGSLLGYIFLASILGCYTFIGGLIWSVQAGKKGLSLITLGSLSILLALYSWTHVFQHSDAVNISLAIISTLLGSLLLRFGIKRYRNRKKTN